MIPPEWTLVFYYFFSQANTNTWESSYFCVSAGNFSTKTKLIHHFLFCWTSLLCRMNKSMRGNHLLVSSAAATHPAPPQKRNEKWAGKILKAWKWKGTKISETYYNLKWLVRRTLEFGFTRDRRTDFREKRSEEAVGLARRIYTLSEFSRDDCWVRDYNPLEPVLQPPHSHPLTTRHDFAVFPYHSSRIFPPGPCSCETTSNKTVQDVGMKPALNV